MDRGQDTYRAISLQPYDNPKSTHLLLRPTQCDMFEYVRHAGGVRWIGLESNTEYIILIFSRYMKVVCARLIVLEVQRG